MALCWPTTFLGPFSERTFFWFSLRFAKSLQPIRLKFGVYAQGYNTYLQSKFQLFISIGTRVIEFRKNAQITIFCNLQKNVWTDLDPTRRILFFLKLRIFFTLHFFLYVSSVFFQTRKTCFGPFDHFFLRPFRKFSSVQFCFNRFLLQVEAQVEDDIGKLTS